MENLEQNSKVETIRKENNFALATTDVSNDLFGESKTKRKTTLDITDEKQADMFLNSQSECDAYVKDMVGKNIEVHAVSITETPSETFNEETGELIVRTKHSMVLFDKEGKTYVTGSNSFYYSFMLIASVKGLPTFENPLKITIIETDAEQKGHKYLKCKIAK